MKFKFLIDQANPLKVNAQGYLVVPAKIAKVGVLDYQGKELGIDGVEANKFYKVEVTAEELFSPEAMQSFEGQAVTLLHPDGLEVNSDNWKDLAIGHLQNIRRDGDYLVGDAYVTDGNAIRVIQENGIRELSIGHDCQIVKGDKEDFKKTRIIGNHCAVVPSGRAGFDCKLGDEGNFMKTLAARLMSVLVGSTRRLGDSDEAGKEELEQALASLKEALAALQEAPDDTEGKEEQIADLESQIEDIQAKLDAMNESSTEPMGDEEPSGAPLDKQEEDVEALKARIKELEDENAALREKVAALESEKDKETAVADAKARFPKVKIGDAKNARQVHAAVLLDSGAFSKNEVNAMSNAEVKAAYAAMKAVSAKKTSVGKTLLGDSKPSAKSASRRLGGK